MLHEDPKAKSVGAEHFCGSDALGDIGNTSSELTFLWIRCFVGYEDYFVGANLYVDPEIPE